MEGQPTNQPVEEVAASIRRLGFGSPIVARPSDHRIVCGHTRHAAALLLGLEVVPVRWLELGDRQAAALALADNKLGEKAAWESRALADVLAELRAHEADLVAFTGFDSAAVDALLAKIAREDRSAAGKDPDAMPERPKARAKLGQVWQLGRHRLAIGDCTDPRLVAKLLDGAAVDALLADPPYCSGGFQDAGRSSGSKGTTAKGKAGRGKSYKASDIKNDTLSARGFQALLGAAIIAADARGLYLFTDWRMWTYLFDICESKGYGVRNMIVWDKGSPGMGVGWRAQHELVMFATRETQLWGTHTKKGAGAFGNVLSHKRTGNLHHVTEKPVALVGEILKASPWAERVLDSFAGSGTTLLACEVEGRTGYAIELAPKVADVALARYEGYTGGVAELAEGKA